MAAVYHLNPFDLQPWQLEMLYANLPTAIAVQRELTGNFEFHSAEEVLAHEMARHGNKDWAEARKNSWLCHQMERKENG